MDIYSPTGKIVAYGLGRGNQAFVKLHVSSSIPSCYSPRILENLPRSEGQSVEASGESTIRYRLECQKLILLLQNMLRKISCRGVGVSCGESKHLGNQGCNAHGRLSSALAALRMCCAE